VINVLGNCTLASGAVSDAPAPPKGPGLEQNSFVIQFFVLDNTDTRLEIEQAEWFKDLPHSAFSGIYSSHTNT
jgi:hypothetical protein